MVTTEPAALQTKTSGQCSAEMLLHYDNQPNKMARLLHYPESHVIQLAGSCVYVFSVSLDITFEHCLYIFHICLV